MPVCDGQGQPKLCAIDIASLDSVASLFLSLISNGVMRLLSLSSLLLSEISASLMLAIMDMA